MMGVFNAIDGAATDTFVRGMGELILLDKVDCTGLEKNLTLCGSKKQFTCSHQQVAGAICKSYFGTI